MARAIKRHLDGRLGETNGGPDENRVRDRCRSNIQRASRMDLARAYHRCQHQRRVVAPAKSLDARKHEPPAVSSISSSVSGSLRSRPPCRSDGCSCRLRPRLTPDNRLSPFPSTFLILFAASPGFGRCFALNI